MTEKKPASVRTLGRLAMIAQALHGAKDELEQLPTDETIGLREHMAIQEALTQFTVVFSERTEEVEGA